MDGIVQLRQDTHRLWAKGFYGSFQPETSPSLRFQSPHVHKTCVLNNPFQKLEMLVLLQKKRNLGCNLGQEDSTHRGFCVHQPGLATGCPGLPKVLPENQVGSDGWVMMPAEQGDRPGHPGHLHPPPDLGLRDAGPGGSQAPHILPLLSEDRLTQPEPPQGAPPVGPTDRAGAGNAHVVEMVVEEAPILTHVLRIRKSPNRRMDAPAFRGASSQLPGW